MTTPDDDTRSIDSRSVPDQWYGAIPRAEHPITLVEQREGGSFSFDMAPA